MNTLSLLLILFIFSTKPVLSQGNQGGRLTAMGNNGSAVKDIWGVEANPAAITGIKQPSVQTNYEKHFFAKELSSQAIAFVFPGKSYVFGLNLQRFGIPEYQALKTGIVVTKQFGKNLSLDSRINYHQLKIANYGAATGISIDIGTTYQLSEALCLGLYLNNPSKQSYPTQLISSTIPTTAYIGIAYQPNAKFLIAGTVHQELRTPVNIAIGIDYQLIQSFSIRSGLSLTPFKHYLGIGFSAFKFVADMAFTQHPSFGYSPQITIGYVF